MTDSIAKKQTEPRAGNKLKISDLAKHLGLSKGTVSRALSGYPDIAVATRERVTKAARDLGYRPTSSAQALSTGLARSAALILSVSGDSVQKAYLPDFLDGASTRLGKDNWTLTVATASPEQDDIAVHKRLIEERKVDGFIITRTRRADPRVALMKELGVPFVMYGRMKEMEGCPYFDFSGEDAMHDAVVHLAGLGHRRIGFIGARDAFFMQELRAEGFAAGMKAAGLGPQPELMRTGGMTEAAGEELAIGLLAEPEPPTAIVCAMDVAALGAYRAVRAAELEVGREVSIMSYDGIGEGAYAQPPLTTFSVDTRAGGYALADLLLARIGGAPAESLRRLDPAKLIARGSDRPPAISSEDLARRLSARR